ncbi:hypothetical protein V8C86DRAFT_3140462 [Haematococcus lacustris]
MSFLSRCLGVGRYVVPFTSRQIHMIEPASQTISRVVLLSSRVVVKLDSRGRFHEGTLSLQLHDLRDNSPCDLWTWRKQQEGRRKVEQKVDNGESVTANGVTLSLNSHGRTHKSWATLIEKEEADMVKYLADPFNLTRIDLSCLNCETA